MSTVMMICQRTALLKARLIVEFVTLSIIEPLSDAFGKGRKKSPRILYYSFAPSQAHLRQF